jgi:hypothetical protein
VGGYQIRQSLVICVEHGKQTGGAKGAVVAAVAP